MSSDDDWPDRVRRRREALGWTAYRLAKMARVHPTTITNLEKKMYRVRGSQQTTRDAIERVLDAGERRAKARNMG
jgi:ribosome-binding protein aMBF1 (putative translation factor)